MSFLALMEQVISASCFLNFSMASLTAFSTKCSSGYMPRYSCKERGDGSSSPGYDEAVCPYAGVGAPCPYLVLLVLTEGPDSPEVPAGATAIREALNDHFDICNALLFGWGPSHGRGSIGDPGIPVILQCSTEKHFLVHHY